MKGALSLLAALAVLGGCHRAKTDALLPDAQAEAQTRTSAKALADVAAAEEAARVPLPERASRAKAAEPQEKPAAKAPAAAAESAAEMGAGELSLNESDPR
ncbi:hypothetical protein [Sphingomonas sp.]|uniref:hypothetical protein n=1 Tax=Sphingomonas sp. TaxID=28214 RepID=UPI000DB54A1E|nr:hypothetical protein [Sphingomonas sp.]PZU08534.1 MAG: hypothetical protein DI605_11205 [Sphingomonas sp.]